MRKMIALESFILIEALVVLVFMIWHWIAYSKNYKFPLQLLFFFSAKYLSDISLKLSIPSKVIWTDLEIFGYTITNKHLFHANVDPYTGLNVLFLFYCFELGEVKRE